MSDDEDYEYYEQVKNGGLIIELNNMHACGKGAQQIANALKHPDTQVQVLWLDENDIGHEDAAVLSEALKSNSTLQELRLLEHNISFIDRMGPMRRLTNMIYMIRMQKH